MKTLRLAWLVALTVTLVACGGSETPVPTTAAATPVAEQAAQEAAQTAEGETTVFELTSSAFAHEEPIPTRYSCDGDDVSPPLAWSDPPAGTESLALIMDDPDAPGGVWDHWLVYNLPADSRSLPENASPGGELPAGAVQGLNGWGESRYGGPCPPGETHRYVFRLYALDTALDLAAGAGKATLEGAMEGHVLAQAELAGTYTR